MIMMLARKYNTISVQQLSQLLKSPPQALQLLDVRDSKEFEIVSIPGFVNSLQFSKMDSDLKSGKSKEEIASAYDKNKKTIVTCHHGGRKSAACSQLLQEQGFTDVNLLEGGIDAYAEKIDPSLKRY